MAQHYWLMKRALRLQTACRDLDEAEKKLALFLRYQITHDRTFHKALNTLLSSEPTRGKWKLALFCNSANPKSTPAAKPPKRKQELHKWRVLRTQVELGH